MATASTPFDSQLHVLRTVGRSFDDIREAQEFDSARFNLYAAIRQEDWDLALLWLRAVQTALDVGQHRIPPTAHLAATAAANETKRGLQKLASGE